MTNETMKDGERAAFEAWFATSGIWNEAVARRTWSAACDWMRDVAAKAQHDEPRNVNGMTRSEFEHYLRVGYQHDNVRAQERGLGPEWPNGQIGLTPQDEREIAERVERNYPTLGTFACPICGKDVPHEHSAEDIVAHRNEQKARATSLQAGEKGEECQRLEKIGREFEDCFGHITPEEACRTINELQGKLNASAVGPQAASDSKDRTIAFLRDQNRRIIEVADRLHAESDRYRWLRRQAVATHSYDELICRWEVDYVLRGESFDEAIDAARKAEIERIDRAGGAA